MYTDNILDTANYEQSGGKPNKFCIKTLYSLIEKQNPNTVHKVCHLYGKDHVTGSLKSTKKAHISNQQFQSFCFSPNI